MQEKKGDIPKEKELGREVPKGTGDVGKKPEEKPWEKKPEGGESKLP